MDLLTMCRICFISDVRMHCIYNTYLQDIFEKLTTMPFKTKDLRPLQVCYICYARLQSCFQLRATCLKSEELFTQILESDGLQLIPHQIQKVSKLQIVQPVTVMQLNCASEAADDSDSVIKLNYDYLQIDVQVKEEYVEVDDTKHEEDLIQSMGQRDTLNTENVNTVYNDDISDIKAEDTVFDSCEFHGNSDHRHVGAFTANSHSGVDNSIPSMILRDKCRKPVKSILHTLTLEDIGTGAPVPTKLKLAKLDKTRGKKSNKLVTVTFKHNKNVSENIQTTGKAVIEKAAVDTSSEVRIHTTEVQYKCHLCDKCFKDKYNLSKHIPVCSVDKVYKCDTCNKRFNLKGNLFRHILIHTGEKAYKCDTCDKRFNLKGNLSTHIRTHTGEKPYKCDTCEKRFNLKPNLLRHVRIHTGEKPYQCDTCEKRCINKSDLIKHIRTHTGEKPYKCKVCEKRFNQMSILLRHILVHTGEKPYKCDMCNKSFNRKSILLTHSRSHSGEKPYKCDMCDKRFRQKSGLLTHIRIHTGEKPYRCVKCNKYFRQKGALSRHLHLHTVDRQYK